MWLHMQMHFYMFESFQLERLYVTNFLHRFSVNVYSEGKERKIRSSLFFFSFFWCIMASLNRNFIWCNWSLVYGTMTASDRTGIPGGRRRAVVGWKEPRVRNRKKQVFTGSWGRLCKYHPALCVVIELCVIAAVPLAQDEQERGRERRLNRENQTWMSSIVYVCQVCLVLKRCKSCQFLCSLLRRIRVVKERRSTLS